MASRMAFLQLGRGSASLACSGGTVMAGPSMVSWQFVLCKPKPPTDIQRRRAVGVLLDEECHRALTADAPARFALSPGSRGPRRQRRVQRRRQ